MPLGMPRQQHMVMGQRLRDAAGNSNDLQRSHGSDAVAWGDNHGRAQFAHAIRVRNVRPDNTTELEWPRHVNPLWSSKRLGFIPFKPLLGRRGDLYHLRPIDVSRELLGLILRQQLP